MAGVTPKFKVEWTTKDKKTYSVSGNTYEDAFKFFAEKNASKEEWAAFSHERPGLTFLPAKGEPITEVTLEVGYTITMPSWSKANSLGKNRKAAWDKMMTALGRRVPSGSRQVRRLTLRTAATSGSTSSTAASCH